MFRTYRTANETIIGEEAKSADIILTLIRDFEGKEYVMVRTQEEKAMYNLSLIGQVTEVVDDISFQEFRQMIYARPDNSK